MKVIKKTKLCSMCPASRSNLNPSQYALNKIYENQTDKSVRKKDETQNNICCEWYINSSEYGYCFWRFAEELNNSPIPDREICHLECITHAQLKDTIKSALGKLRREYENGNEDVREFVELLIDKINIQKESETIYVSNEVQEAIDNEEMILQDEEEEPVKKKPGRKPMNMPVHRDGVKTDLYGLYSPKKLEEIKNEEKIKPKPKKSSSKKAL